MTISDEKSKKRIFNSHVTVTEGSVDNTLTEWHLKKKKKKKHNVEVAIISACVTIFPQSLNNTTISRDI